MKYTVPITLLALFSLSLRGAQDADFADANPNAVGAGQSPPMTIGGFRFGTYRVTPLDRLNVSVFGEPELTVSEIVDRHGMIHLRLIGEIKIALLTVNEVEKKNRTGIHQPTLLAQSQGPNSYNSVCTAGGVNTWTCP